MGYEKPSDKLTFYKAFFSPQWKFLIHAILQCLSAKTTSWNEFSSTMTSAIICLATNQKFNFSRYILLSLVKNIEAGVPFFMFPRFVQLIINHQLGDMTHHKEIFDTSLLTKKVFVNMKRVCTGFSREVTLLFDNMLVQALEEVGILQADAQSIPIPTKPSTSKPQKKHKPKRKHKPKNLSGKDSLKLKELMDFCTNLSNKVLDLESEVINIKSTYQARIEKLKKVERLEEENKRRKITDIDADVKINLEKVQAEAYNLDLDYQEKVLSMLDVNDEEPANVEEVLEVVTTAKLITEVVTTAKDDVTATCVEVPKPRKRKGVIIQDPEKTTTTTTTTVTVQPKVQAKDKGKAILIEEPKPLKRQVKIELDEEVARQLEAELNADVDWNVVIEQVQRREKLTDAVMKCQALKKKPLTEVKARSNMIVYLKNMVDYKINYFKGMTYDEIRPLFKKHYNYNQAFLNKVNEEVKVPEREVRKEKQVEVESSKREGESLEKEVAKKQKMEQETEELRKCLQIVLNDDDYVERYEKTEPKNFSDDYLLNTLKIMFKNPNVEDNVWKDQKGKYGLAKVKSWKLIDSCGVHCLTLSTTQMFLLVEKMYHLTHYTLEQMVNDVRLQVDVESETSLELLRLVRRKLIKGYKTQ
nr:hypothetical protein [Tanacetum cinerariifolium]